MTKNWIRKNGVRVLLNPWPYYTSADDDGQRYPKGPSVAASPVKTVRVWNFFGWKVWTRDFDGQRVKAGGTYRDRQEAEAGARELSYRTFTGRNAEVWS